MKKNQDTEEIPMLVKRDFIYTPKGKNRPLHIWLPEDYATSGKRYPVTSSARSSSSTPRKPGP